MVCVFQKKKLSQAEQFSSRDASGIRFLFLEIYLERIWTGQTRASVLLCLQRNSTVDHPSLLSGHVTVKSCQKAPQHTRPLCFQCVVGAFTVYCGCFVLVSEVGPGHIGESCPQESLSSPSELGDPSSATCLMRVSATVVITMTNLWISLQIATACG